MTPTNTLPDLSGLSDAQIEAICRAHDREDSAQRGEPSPWFHQDCEGDCADCQEFRRDRLAAMRIGLAALSQGADQ